MIEVYYFPEKIRPQPRFAHTRINGVVLRPGKNLISLSELSQLQASVSYARSLELGIIETIQQESVVVENKVKSNGIRRGKSVDQPPESTNRD